LAIYCGLSYGPIFGHTNNTICLYDNSNANTSSYVRPEGEYNIPKAANGESILTDGNKTFKTSEIEVWSIQ
jgi:hypothetical protein